jgi:hypothetical protein
VDTSRPPVPTGAGIAGFTTLDPLGLRKGGLEQDEITELSATGVEGMLEALEVVNQKTDKQAMGAKVGKWDRCRVGADSRVGRTYRETS